MMNIIIWSLAIITAIAAVFIIGLAVIFAIMSDAMEDYSADNWPFYRPKSEYEEYEEKIRKLLNK
jgi:hypothetical protein